MPETPPNAESCGTQIDPNNAPNAAYEIGHLSAASHGLPPDWWTVFCNGIPVHHFTPRDKEKAERYCRDPAWRLSLERKYIHD